MATPLSATALVSALRAEGCKVVEVREWRTHNRNHKGAWGPVHGVLLHHTVTSGTSRTVDICYNGYTELPGPLCHGVIAKDGTVYLVGNGRANHAGSGDDDVLGAVINESALPAPNENNTDGNARFYGFECENLGNNVDPWPLVQVEAMVRASAALCRAHGWGKDGDTSVIGHKEWTNTKIDPRGPIQGGGSISMNNIRSRVAERLRHPASWNPEEDDVALTDADIDKIAKRVLTIDGVINSQEPPYNNSDWDTNKHWGLKYTLYTGVRTGRETLERVKTVEDELAAIGEKIDALTVGGVDLDALAAKVADLLAARLAD